ncbi:DUF3967 domain-containing protein [Priestia aryabhattai]|uniref:DUF3967 domain-containing protein n=1 Tax=Priestia megaterium TaxID=1404 RepID=UPI0039B8A175
MNDNRKEYATRDIANIVNIAEPTVRKYAQSLEKAGYIFVKNEHGYRIFTDKDIFTFNEMKNLSMKHGLPTKKVVDMIMMNLKEQNEGSIPHVSEVDTVVKKPSEQEKTTDIAQYDERFNSMFERLEQLDKLDDMQKQLDKQNEFNQLLMERLEQQQKYIDEKIEKRDKQFIDAIRESQETKKLIASALEQREKEEQNKGFFARLFGKG